MYRIFKPIIYSIIIYMISLTVFISVLIIFNTLPIKIDSRISLNLIRFVYLVPLPLYLFAGYKYGLKHFILDIFSISLISIFGIVLWSYRFTTYSGGLTGLIPKELSHTFISVNVFYLPSIMMSMSVGWVKNTPLHVLINVILPSALFLIGSLIKCFFASSIHKDK